MTGLNRPSTLQIYNYQPLPYNFLYKKPQFSLELTLLVQNLSPSFTFKLNNYFNIKVLCDWSPLPYHKKYTLFVTIVQNVKFE
jgi:hypothetical protein